MAALDPTQAAKKIIYAYASTGVTELKGGVNWTKGVAGTGIGTPGLPYLDWDEVMQAIRTYEAQEMITQDYEIRFVTDPAETTDYGNVIHASDDDYPSVDDGVSIFTIKGWLKTWGDPVYGSIGGVWAAHADKPTHGYYERTATGNAYGPQRMIFKDTEFVNDGTSKQDVIWKATAENNWLIRFDGCGFSGSSSRTGWLSLAEGVNRCA